MGSTLFCPCSAFPKAIKIVASAQDHDEVLVGRVVKRFYREISASSNELTVLYAIGANAICWYDRISIQLSQKQT